MFSSFSLPLGWLRGSSVSGRNLMNLKPVQEHHIESSSDRRARTLKHLLKANHTNHSIIYHNLQFHNHAPHILGSAHILGANANQMQKIYDKEDEELEPWKDSPSEISKHDWRDYLGKRTFQRAYIDFFEDELVAFGYDWKKLLEYYLFEGKEPLINSVVSGLAHPLIHLGYAYELSSQTVGIEALGLTACFYSDLHKYIDDPAYTRPSTFKSRSILEILQRVAADQRFDDHSSEAGEESIMAVVDKKEDLLLNYWNAWDITAGPRQQFADSQKAATAVLVGTRKPTQKYDFFLLHLLTSSHAVRVLLPVIPDRFQLSLVRQWWLFTLMAYIGQLRPAIDLHLIEDYDLQGRGWKHVNELALTSPYAQDAHYVKGIRAVMNAAETWEDDSEYYLKAGMKFAEEFDEWGFENQ